MIPIAEMLRGRNGAAVETHNRLVRWVVTLSHTIGERNLRDIERYCSLRIAEEFLRSELTSAGIPFDRQAYSADGRDVANLEVVFGQPDAEQVWVVGAHYDSAERSPGGNDNATGVALLLELAQSCARHSLPPDTALRLVFFCTEEPPRTRTHQMGSAVYARRCRDRGDRLRGMISLETLGSFYEGHRGKDAPFPLNHLSPWRGDFLAVVGNMRSTRLVSEVSRALEPTVPLRVRPFVAPQVMPLVRASDHWSFWNEGYPAVMLTDTAPIRTRHYHSPTDTPDRIDFVRLTRLAQGLPSAIDALLGD